MPKSTLDTDIEKATNECNVSEDWQMFMDICDQIKTLPNGNKDGLKSIMKRVSHPVPHVSLQALTLLATCVSNCGKQFHLELCSREWTNDAKNIFSRGHVQVSRKLRELVQQWTDDFKQDPQLNLMAQFCKKLKADGYTFDKETKSDTIKQPKSKNDELSFKEDIDLAIAMSLQDSDAVKQTPGSSSLYPSSLLGTGNPSYEPSEEREVCRVRALYDFEAAEDNEMTFKMGEVFSVLDNSDQNWWKGRNSNGIGLFPSNFVTTDLSQPSQERVEKKKVRFVDGGSPSAAPCRTEAKLVISDEHLDLTLSMLKNASPDEIDDEEETIVSMEERSSNMRAPIERKIAQSASKKEQLNQLNEKFLQALSTYQRLIKEPMVQPQHQYQPVVHPTTNYQQYRGFQAQHQGHEEHQPYVTQPYHQGNPADYQQPPASYQYAAPASYNATNSNTYYDGGQYAVQPTDYPSTYTAQQYNQTPVYQQ